MSFMTRPNEHPYVVIIKAPKIALLAHVNCPLRRVINDVCQYSFDGDSYFAVFYTYKKEYMIIFPKFYGSAWWIFISKKFGKGEDKKKMNKKQAKFGCSARPTDCITYIMNFSVRLPCSNF